MTRVRPRVLVHRGTIEAAGFVFDARLLGQEEARRRVLAVWKPGTQIYRMPSSLLVRLPTAQCVVCTCCPGLPLVRQGELLTSAPLEEDERDALACPVGSVILVQAGMAEVQTLTPDLLEDPADWLEMADWSVVEAHPLGATPATPRLLAEPVPFDSRRQLAGVPPAAPELARLILSLQIAAPETRPSFERGLFPIALVAASLARLGSRLARLLRPVDLGIGGVGQARQGGMAGPTAAPLTAPAGRNQWADGLQRLAARLLVLSRLGPLVGRRQARYIGRMMQLFEQGQLLEALRHAIPLGGDGEGGPLPPYLGLPTARPNLDLHPQMARSGGAINMPPDLLETLRTLYRDAFSRLELEGQIEEAAFVLAELLHASEEAVAFLERHGRLRLAAEMAEGRRLPPGLVVRQWWIAGERERAQQIARRTGTFADAVLRLERTDKEQAKVLRLAWAAALARSGQFAVAVDTAWPVAEARHLTTEWLERAIAAGGTAGARMLARKLSLLPETFEDIRRHALELLGGDDAALAPARAAFAVALQAETTTPASLTLARAAVRAVVRDLGNGEGRLTPNALKQLVGFSGDGPLKTDLPDISSLTGQIRSAPLEIVWDVSDAGSLSVSDAAFLPDGRTLVALGEVGARLLSREGRIIAHFDQPAHRLVVADGGDRAITLAPRGDVYRLARLDLAQRRAEDWCEAALGAWASGYDGSLWFVASGRDFVAVDALEHRFSALWRTPEVPGAITEISRSPEHCSFLLHSRGDTDDWGRPAEAWERWNRWQFDLPALALRDRGEAAVPQGAILDLRRSVSPKGRVADLVMRLPAYLGGVLPFQKSMLTGPVSLEIDGKPLTGITFGVSERPRQVVASDTRLAALTEDSGGLTVSLLNLDQGKTQARVRLAGASRACLRLTVSALTIADDRGRLLALDLETSLVLRDLRIG